MEEYKELLKNVLKEENKHSPGLFFGDMGVCMSLYIMNKIFKDDDLERLADELLDRVIASIVPMKDLSFDTGLSGIGWAISLLHANDCIEGDIDDILFNIDAMIYKSLYEQNRYFQCDLMKGWTGFLVYFLYRLKYTSNNAGGIQESVIESALRMVIDKLENAVPSQFGSISKDLYSTILWDFPILFFCLGEVIRLGIYREKIEGMLNSWSYLFTTTLPFLHANRLALANSLAYVNQVLKNNNVDAYIDTLFYSINFDDYLHDIDKASVVLNGDWFCALFNVCKAIQLMDHSHVRYSALEAVCPLLYKYYCENVIEKLNNFPDKQRNGSLINGISGVMLSYCLFQNLFHSAVGEKMLNYKNIILV